MEKRYLPIYSINYDFLPSSTYRDKTLWIVTDEVPPNLDIGQFVKLVSVNSNLIFPKSILQVEDIEGKRIILSSKLVPKRIITSGGNLRFYNSPPQAFLPQPSSSNMLNTLNAWGHVTRDYTYLPGQYRGWQYGYGDVVGYLSY